MARLTRNGKVAFLWPVYSYAGQHQTLVYFFDYGDAVDFVNGSDRDLYIGEPRYDHVERVQIVDVEHIAPGRVVA